MAATAYIALGSNLGDREANLEAALERLRRAPGIEVVETSSIYETEPIGGPPDQPDYLNAVVAIRTDLEPGELLHTLLQIEEELGRVRGEKNAPRTIDLDLLLYEDQVLDAPGLTVPHPRMHLRGFVLEPLAEIAPDVRHPVLNKTIEELWDEFDPEAVAGAVEEEESAAEELPQSSGAKVLLGKTALVTGATGGIGQAIAQALALAGANVIVHARDRHKAQGVADELDALGVQSAVLLADLSRPDDCEKLVETAWEECGPLDIWINNAGVDTLTGEAAEWSFERKLEALYLVDLRATILLSRSIGRYMQTEGRGVILNIGWDKAECGMEGDSGELFAAIKGGVMAFTKSLALTLAPHVRVNCLAPGWIRTAWGEQASDYWQERVLRETPAQRWGTPQDVAAAACWLVSPAASFVTGQVIRVNGGAVR